jgi:hypothetical protein
MAGDQHSIALSPGSWDEESLYITCLEIALTASGAYFANNVSKYYRAKAAGCLQWYLTMAEESGAVELLKNLYRVCRSCQI